MNRGLKGLDGFPLEFILTMKGIGMKMTAKSISMDKIDDSIFKIPEGYKEMTMEEAMKSQTNTNTEVKSDTILTKKTPKAPDFVMPSFPGGDDSLLNYLSKNVKYPDKARKDKIEGKVLVTFMVNADGRLSDFNILISLSEECDAEAMRVVKAMPNWIPAKRNGKIYPIKMNLPVWFKL
jgi:protein TonB